LFAEETARAAGEVLLKYFGRIHEVEYKGSKDFATKADFESEKEVVRLIREEYPEHNISSEEMGELNNGSKYTWYVDPLDGTHNFFYGLPYFGVSIGLTLKNQPLLGVIYLPAENQMFTAQKNKGAFFGKKRMRVSTRNLPKSLVFYDSRFNIGTEEKMRSLSRLSSRVFSIRSLGVATASFAFLASGKADAYVMHSVKSWDIMAGALLVEEAGGKVTDFRGRPWSADSENLLASNRTIHKQILKAVAP